MGLQIEKWLRHYFHTTSYRNAFDGCHGEIAVYDLKGAAVYKGKRAGMPEHLKGLYIVKLGGKAVKCRF